MPKNPHKKSIQQLEKDLIRILLTGVIAVAAKALEQNTANRVNDHINNNRRRHGEYVSYEEVK